MTKMLTLFVLVLSIAGFSDATGEGAIKQTETQCPWSDPVNLGPNVNSEYNDITPGISPDGLSIYFDSPRPGGIPPAEPNPSAEDIWVSHRASVNDPWQPAVNVTVINSPAHDAAPSLTPDGLTMYFHSGRANHCGLVPRYDAIFVTHRTDPTDDFGWDTPQDVGCQLLTSPGDSSGPAFFQDGSRPTLFFAGGSVFDVTQYDIYTSTMDCDGQFCAGVLVPELSSPAPYQDTRPTIRLAWIPTL